MEPTKILSQISGSISGSNGESHTRSNSITQTWDIKEYEGYTYVAFVPYMRVCKGLFFHYEFTSVDG